ncbi:hypothetical protein CH373_08725 [Leptospira perolatii]|uniref:Desulfoferrodoxin ferrous iron-binding domain-containing protein n=1 Tax=Leptospira perolatii TaxID=2023191 RepID=A0A2M9ZNG2_9LEPT|nr:desulfoferrodoxin family protein [Leptospira perolatii]PJZ69587.1 hypothetical protein CH360_09870 [Leptospira perolatii]PJZ73574.1 hypothetical protein CH373_08725 [Leptospira perolatii]
MNKIAEALHLFLFFLSIFIFEKCNFNESDTKPKTPKAEYTAQDPGEWEGMESSHAPLFTVEKLEGGKTKITVTVKENSLYNASHYIERIGIFNKDKIDIVGKSFQKPAHGLPSTRAELVVKDLSNDPHLKVYLKCNLHDLWTAPLFPKSD